MLELRSACSLVLFAGAMAVLPPTASGLRNFGNWCLRPARLPFAWQAMQTAADSGDSQEVFARGQQLMQLVPAWTDGHSAMVYRYVLTHEVGETPGDSAIAAEKRLQVGLALLEQARSSAGKREYSLLHAAAYLPDVACRQLPGLAERLQNKQAGGAAAIADHYFREAARLFPTPAIKEQQLWYAPQLAASLLACGAKTAAIAVLDDAIVHAPEMRDKQLATPWAARLQEVVAWLRGDHTVDLQEVFEDRRFVLLQPFLRD
jgi:hypothetical protein